MQSGVFEAEHELSELRASLQSEQDGLERRAAALAEESSRHRRKNEQLESQKVKMESERRAWSNGAAERRDAEARLAEAQDATVRLKVVYSWFHSHFPHVFSCCKTSILFQSTIIIVVLLKMVIRDSKWNNNFKMKSTQSVILHDRCIHDVGNENDTGHEYLSVMAISNSRISISGQRGRPHRQCLSCICRYACLPDLPYIAKAASSKKLKRSQMPLQFHEKVSTSKLPCLNRGRPIIHMTIAQTLAQGSLCSQALF